MIKAYVLQHHPLELVLIGLFIFIALFVLLVLRSWRQASQQDYDYLSRLPLDETQTALKE